MGKTGATGDAGWASVWLRASGLVAVITAFFGFAAAPVYATHERAALITWAPVTGIANTVEFTITGAWRRSAYSTANNRCRDWSVAGFPAKPCSGADGFAAVGDVIVETQGNTVFNPGQGSTISSPAGALAYVVTAVDPANDWLYGTAIDPTSLPSALDTTIQKTYTTGDPRTAFIEDCCRISNSAPNQHINNPDKNYRIETRVDPDAGNRPPVSTMPPIVLCPINGTCVFNVPANDPDGNTITYRFSTAGEATGAAANFVQPGPPNSTFAATIDNAGVYTWNTTGATVGSPGSNTYYSTQVMIEDRDGANQVKSRVAVDFLIQLVAQAGQAPVFDHGPTPACGTVFTVAPDATVAFTVQASDSDFGQNVTLNVTGMPSGATMTPALPTTGNPVSSGFSWTPGGGAAGTTHVVNFTAVDDASLQSQCALTIEVSQCTTNAQCDDGNLCTDDVCAPGSPGANAGGCVNSPHSCNACQMCDPGLGCTGSVCTPVFSPTPSATPTVTSTATSTVTGTPQSTSTATLTPTQTNTPAPFCGDGHVDAGETCDDGNMISGDGCDANCQPSTSCSFDHLGSERFVGGCGAPSFGNIQSAVDASLDGDVVSVCPGTYTQPVVITKQIKLRAATGGGVTVHTSGTTIDVRRSGVQIEGLALQSDTASAIDANNICPLSQSSCASPGYGSNLTITKNTITNSTIGIGWQRRIDCASILENILTGNATHIRLEQQEGTPAILVSIVDNQITAGGQSGRAVSLSGLNILFAANMLQDATNDGLAIAGIPVGASQIIENSIAANAGDGIVVGIDAETVPIHDNNITDNVESGLANESIGTVDATLNWWDSQTGPSGVYTGVGDSIVNRNGGTTEFLEFLCKPFPQGFPSTLGICSTETPELKQLLPGRAPDLDTFGRYIVFESAANLDVDPRTDLTNGDLSKEVFLLNRRPKKTLGGKCLGGLAPCDFTDVGSCPSCSGRADCPGDPSADPIVLNGECVLVTQLSNGDTAAESAAPRFTGLAKSVVYASTADPTGTNGDASKEIVEWSRTEFEQANTPVPLTMSSTVIADGVAPVHYDVPAPALNGKYIAVESDDTPPGTSNSDGNVEIFVYKPRSQEWLQITNTTAPADNRRPATTDGRRVVFDSTGDLTGENADGNRELFQARLRAGGMIELQQITHTTAPADTHSGSIDAHSALVVFSSTGDLVPGQNSEGNREIFSWSRRTGQFVQITHSVSGDSENPVINMSQRFVVFDTTADDLILPPTGATNRRIYQYDRFRGSFTLLSRSRFGSNQAPRIRKRRFVVWESTANLTGNNPNGDWVIYVFDRKKD